MEVGSAPSDNFHDAKDGWEKVQEGHGMDLVQTKLSKLLEGIDQLMEREIKAFLYSSDDDQQRISREIRELGKKFQAY